MSFQHFRLGDIALHQPLPPHLAHTQSSSLAQDQQNLSSTSQFSAQLDNSSSTFASHKGHTSTTPSSSSKQPYGSGDTDDGYTLVFENLDAFNEWRNNEEERQMVEFVKGDTHGSKAVPPRFKDHTKLVCARHSRSGRKKYVKKHPERVRKVPSRKLEGQGCSASISYKTYFDTEEVRACYVSQHSHEIGMANLPYTRRGRKAAVQQEKDRSRKAAAAADGGSDTAMPAPVSSGSAPSSNGQTTSSPSSFPPVVPIIAPLPTHSYPVPPPPQHYGYPGPAAQPYQPPPPVQNQGISHDRWENMSTLFHSIREHSRGFEYPTPSVAALETVLIRLYLESPVGLGAQPSMGSVIQNAVGQPRPVPTSTNANGRTDPGSGDNSNS